MEGALLIHMEAGQASQISREACCTHNSLAQMRVISIL